MNFVTYCATMQFHIAVYFELTVSLIVFELKSLSLIFCQEQGEFRLLLEHFNILQAAFVSHQDAIEPLKVWSNCLVNYMPGNQIE